MKPISLALQGLYSYQNPVEIDFSRLTSGGLFGIFGKVGSGKSSLLEAITFALYGETDRMNKSDKRGYNMMNLRSKSFEVDFRFEKGGETYRFTVALKRHGKRFEEVQTPERVSYRLDGGNWIPLSGEEATAETILGLSYKNFRRTVIIPQGKFQEFLQLKDSERLEMLEEIFGLKRFNLYGRVSRIKGGADRQAANLEGQLESLGVFDPDEAANLQSRLESLEQERSLADEKAAKLAAAVNEAEELKEAARALLTARTNLTAAGNRLESAREQEILLDRYETARRDLLPLEKNRAERAELLKQVSAERLEMLRRADEAAEAQIEFQTKWNLIEEEYARRDETLSRSRELLSLAEWKGENIKFQQIQSRLTAANQTIESMAADLETLNAAFDLKTGEVKTLRESLPLRDKRLAFSSSVETWRRILSDIESLSDRKKDANSRLSAACDEAGQNVPQAFTGDFSGGVSSKEAAWFKATEEALKDHIEILHQDILISQKLEAMQAPLADLSKQLAAGEPCPLCGSTDHPSPHVAGETLIDGDGKVSVDESSLSVAKEKMNEFLEWRRRWEKVFSRVEATSEEAGRIDEQLTVLEKQIDEHVKKMPQGFMVEPSLDEAVVLIKRWDESDHALDQLQGQADGLRQKRDTLDAQLSSLRASTKGDETALSAIEAVQERLLREISDQMFQDRKGDNQESLAAEGAQLKTQVSLIENRRRQAETLSLEINEAAAKSQAGAEAKKAEEDRTTGEVAAAEEACTAALEASSFSDWDEVRKLLASDIDLEAERRIIKEAEGALAEARQSLSHWEGRLAGRRWNEEEFNEAVDQLAAAKEFLSEKDQALGEIRQRLKVLVDQARKAESVQQELKVVTDRIESLSTLAKLFKGRGFVNFVSTLYLKELVENANRRFEKLTSHSLGLELSDKNDFVVRDYLNDGRTRSVKTLSGGQTFQASFSLALALADSIHREESGFFFLDEGFGSLDKDSLNIVMEALWGLGKENRIVGVISHVEELQKEIPSYLLINKDDRDGSTIGTSWEA